MTISIILLINPSSANVVPESICAFSQNELRKRFIYDIKDKNFCEIVFQKIVDLEAITEIKATQKKQEDLLLKLLAEKIRQGAIDAEEILRVLYDGNVENAMKLIYFARNLGKYKYLGF